ncbi:MAG: hypothetical protein ABI072_03365 [Edaphobacter sp.]
MIMPEVKVDVSGAIETRILAQLLGIELLIDAARAVASYHADLCAVCGYTDFHSENCGIGFLLRTANALSIALALPVVHGMPSERRVEYFPVEHPTATELR